MTDLDLSRCEHEPIHIPGAIQPHGFLLAMREPTLEVMQISANLPELLQRPAEAVLGRALAELLPTEEMELIQQALAAEPLHRANPLKLELDGQIFDGILHRRQGLLLLELEPGQEFQADISRLLGRAIQSLQAASTLQALWAVAVREVRAITGFDRVMLYRFDPDGHGAIWAEARAPEMEPYLGLHFPATDIPRQARELYRLNWLRLIPNARYEPSPLIPEQRPDTGQPLDLSLAVLRSVSPIHRQYMQNMGLLASMSISLMRGEALWGLISCGHRTPRFVSYAARTACETIGQLLSLQITALEELEQRRLRESKSHLAAVLAESMRTYTGDVLLALAQHPAALRQLVDATGVAIVVAEEVITVGAAPAASDVRALCAWLQAQRPVEGLFQTHHLAAVFPPAATYSRQASGVLAMTLPKPGANMVLWFRPEELETVNWGGDPNQPVEMDASAAGGQLHPRRSFALWQETVRERARRWQPAELDAVRALRQRATELDLTRQVKREQDAVQARDDLVAVVSHDLRNPMASVALQASLMKRTLLAETSEFSPRFRAAVDRIHSATERMSNLLQDLLDLSKIEAGRFQVDCKPYDAALLLQDAQELLAPLAEQKSINLSVCAADAKLRVQADAERLFQVFSNLIGNAIKFTPERGSIHLAVTHQDGFAKFSVRDSGAGISLEQQQHIFDRYWQAQNGRAKGVGLGLHITRGIVQAHGGRIWVESEPGAGSVFYFTIPLASQDS